VLERGLRGQLGRGREGLLQRVLRGIGEVVSPFTRVSLGRGRRRRVVLCSTMSLGVHDCAIDSTMWLREWRRERVLLARRCLWIRALTRAYSHGTSCGTGGCREMTKSR
jgi:hypothetical protein